MLEAAQQLAPWKPPFSAALLLLCNAARMRSSVPADDGVARPLADVYAEIRGEARDGVPMFCDGLRAAQIIESVIVSSREQRWVDVETTP